MCHHHNKSAGLPAQQEGSLCRLGLSPWFLLGSRHALLITPHELSLPVYSFELKCVFQPCFKCFLSFWDCLVQTNCPCSSVSLWWSISVFLRALQETHGSCLLPVNSFGDDEELCTSSDTDEEVIKQFEISVSRSQSFRARVSEKSKQTRLEQKPKVCRLLSTKEEDRTQVSACEGILCIQPFLYLDQAWPTGRTSLSHVILHLPLRVKRGR